jgi:hypothetical protein
MAFFLFVDESGQDHRNSPYEVLAGVSVEDRDLWNLIVSIQEAEHRTFGRKYRNNQRELKASVLLKSKTFRLAQQMEEIDNDERTELARQCLDMGEIATKRQLTALAQAKLAFVDDVLKICSRFRCRMFASIIPTDAPRPDPTHLRKDYSYLLERFFYFLEDIAPPPSGIVVFDELEKSQSHILVGQMDSYFKRTSNGQQRSSLIIPEPFFVHSDLTTGIQLADLAAYIVSWGVRFGDMTKPKRPELDRYAELVNGMRYNTTRPVGDNAQFQIWSFKLISDMRPSGDREE